MERNAKIEQITRDLAILHARYASYRRTAAILRRVFIVVTPALAIAALAAAIKLFLFDPLYGLFFTGAVLLPILGIGRFIASSGFRWIDLVSSPVRNIYNPYFFYPDTEPRRKIRSEAEWIEQQMAARAGRLAELGESGGGIDPPEARDA